MPELNSSETHKLKEMFANSPILNPNMYLYTKCEKCGHHTKNENSFMSVIYKLVGNIELLKIWVRRFGKLASYFTTKFTDRATYDADIKEFRSFCLKALDKMYLESEMMDKIDDGDIKTEETKDA